MSDFVFVNNDDQRYRTLQRVSTCVSPPPARVRTRSMSATTQSVLAAANDALAKGCRITVRSGGLLRRLRGEQAAEDHGKSLPSSTSAW